MLKRMSRVLLVLLTLFFTCAEDAMANRFNGEGTAVSPYLIESREDLIAFRDAVNDGNSFAGSYFLQTSDIDLSGIEWVPIGLYESGRYFCGTYDGGGFSIYHLTIREDRHVNPGFFGMLGGTVMNLSLRDGIIDSNYCVGAFAGHASSPDALILNCYSDMQIKGVRAGGIVDNFKGKVLNCVSVSKLNGTDASGGIYSYHARVVENCFSNSDSFDQIMNPEKAGLYSVIEETDIHDQMVMDSLNQWLVQYADDHIELRRGLMYWKMSDKGLGLSEEPYIVHHNYNSLFLRHILNNINEIGIGLAEVIAIVGVIVMLSEYIWSGRKKAAGMLGLTCLIAGAIWSVYTLVIPIARNNMSLNNIIGLVEQKVFCCSLIFVCFITQLLLDKRMLEFCNRRKKHLSNSELKTIVFVGLFAIIQTAVFLIMMIRKLEGRATASVFFQDRNDSFMDLFHSLCTSKSELGYSGGAIYPPLCYVIFKMLGRLMPNNIYKQENAAFLIRDTQEGMVVLLFFLLAAILFVLFSLFYAKKGKERHRIALALCLMFSAPFLFALERANLILYVLGFMLIFVFQYQSENRFAREAALVSLAIAIALKLTPAVLVLLLLLDKDYKAFARTMLYAGILFLLPFSVFGGYAQLPVLIGNLLGRSQGEHVVNAIARYNTVGFGSVYSFIGEMIWEDAGSVSFFQIAGHLTSLLLLVSAVLNTGRRRVLPLILFLCGFSNSNCPYTMIYMFIPLIMFLDDDSPCTRADAVTLFLFIAMFAAYPITNFGAIGELTLWTYDSFQHQTLAVLMQGISLVAIAWVQIVQTSHGVYMRWSLRRGR